MTSHRLHIQRAERLLARLRRNGLNLGSPSINYDRRKLACAVTEDIHDVMGALTASRVVLGDTMLSTLDGRSKAREAEKAIIAAEHALMDYRTAILAPHDLRPWQADSRSGS